MQDNELFIYDNNNIDVDDDCISFRLKIKL